MNPDLLELFIRPDAKNKQKIKDQLNLVCTQLVEFLSAANNRSPLPDAQLVSPADFVIPEEPLPFQEILEQLNTVYEKSMNPSNSKYIGHMDSIPSFASIIGDLVSSALNNNMLSLEMSPYFTQMEYALAQRFARQFGLPETSGGIMLSGGSLSNLQALIVARNQKLALKDGSLYGIKKKPVLFVSEHAHASVVKSAMIMGLGASSVIKIQTSASGVMDTMILEDKIVREFKSGNHPFAVIGTAGYTVTGVIDPLQEIAELAERYHLWFHVDAIYGGALIFSPQHKFMLRGIEHADSISFNPQKWLYVAKTCSMVLFKDFKMMVSHFRTSAPYMKAQNDFINPGEISIQGSRHAEVLKLWLGMLSFGKQKLKELITDSFELSRYFESEVNRRPLLKLAAAPQLNIICFRLVFPHLQKEENDQLNADLQQHLLKGHGFFISLPNYNGSLWLRVVLLNPFTTEENIVNLFREIDRFISQQA